MERSELSDEVQALIFQLEEAALEKGFKEGLAMKVKSVKFEEGDIMVISGDLMKRSVLESIRIQYKALGVRGIINVSELGDVSKLSEVNLSLLGLQKK